MSPVWNHTSSNPEAWRAEQGSSSATISFDITTSAWRAQVINAGGRAILTFFHSRCEAQTWAEGQWQRLREPAGA